ncbi:MAG: Mur ligase family protein [Solirubrobacteraceae bacterium]
MARPRPPLPGGPYLVVGLARSGEAAALALRARGEEVIGCDAAPGDDPVLAQRAQRLSEAGVEVHLDASGDALAARAGTLIKSPGVPQEEPTVVEARRRGVPVLGELELAWRLLANEFVAVTGTNGKTTTCEWIGHIHREAGLPVRVVGNVGTAASSLALESVDARTIVVCEASSFQLEDTVAFAPEAAVLLNVSPDHLDRHPSYEEYVLAKLRIFAGQGQGDIAVIPEGWSATGTQRMIHYGAGPEAGLADEIRLPGEHNRQNGMAAAAVCLARGIDPDAVAAGLRSFQGVSHRLELIATRDGVAWINDSKATNVQSTIVALRAFDGGVHLIAGGDGKGQDFTPLRPLVAERCRAVYLIGEAAPQLQRALSDSGVPAHRVGDLATAVQAARDRAQTGDTVLLSPACASYDQFRDFEARGQAFRLLVEDL